MSVCLSVCLSVWGSCVFKFEGNGNTAHAIFKAKFCYCKKKKNYGCSTPSSFKLLNFMPAVIFLQVFAWVGFAVAVVWIYSIANEIVNLLQVCASSASLVCMC